MKTAALEDWMIRDMPAYAERECRAAGIRKIGGGKDMADGGVVENRAREIAAILRTEGGMNTREIADRMGIKTKTAGNAIDAAKSLGLIAYNRGARVYQAVKGAQQ